MKRERAFSGVSILESWVGAEHYWSARGAASEIVGQIRDRMSMVRPITQQSLSRSILNNT